MTREKYTHETWHEFEHDDRVPWHLLPFDDHVAWLRHWTILLVRSGSHAYGTSLPTSDLDMKGVCLSPPEYIKGFSKKFEQALQTTPDLVVYSLQKFMNLAADCNPSIIEALWVDDEDLLWETHSGAELREHRADFLSQKAKHTFSGYAISQLKRIETHRKWLLAPPTKEPTRADYDLPERKLLTTEHLGVAEAEIRKQVGSWELDLSDLDDARRIYLLERISRMIAERTTSTEHEQATRLLGFEDNLAHYLDAERRFKAAHNEWSQYQNWLVTRNKARSELESKHGYDTKHAMHLVRLLRMCREILETGEVKVRRPDAEELLAIRAGAWSYEQLVEFAEHEDAALYEVMRASKLPKAPDRDKLDRLCMHIMNREGI